MSLVQFYWKRTVKIKFRRFVYILILIAMAKNFNPELNVQKLDCNNL